MIKKEFQKKLIFNAEFVKSSPSLALCPDTDGPEIFFCGRSNSGKSSALNALCGRRKLAHVSKSPGRTQFINFFSVNGYSGHLIDLPGYGYAKVPKKTQNNWSVQLHEFLLKRSTLVGAVLLMDIRHPLKDSDLVMLALVQNQDLETLILLTKSDKVGKSFQISKQKEVREHLPRSTVINFSAKTFMGIERASDWLHYWLTKV